MIGITERGDAALDLNWEPWVRAGKPAILITKDPEKLYHHLGKTMNIIVHCTITGFGGSVLEPEVPGTDDAVHGLVKIAEKIGMKRVVLRIDPIIPASFDIKPSKIALPLKLCGIRKRISFLDNYKHVKKRFRDAGLEPLPYDFHAPLKNRLFVWKKLGKPEVCGEPGMKCTGCVGKKDLDILGVKASSQRVSSQRTACMCLSVKHELLSKRSRCGHGCLYCYWKD